MDAAAQQPGSSRMRAYFTRVRGEIRPGPHRLQRLCSWPLLSRLEGTPTILVSGSNGKGSVCALLEAALRGSGHKTALYTSPHLRHPNERLRFDGRPVSTECLDAALEEVERDCLPRLPDASFFEVATATCFLAVAKRLPDVFIAEIGLGGRHDSVNVLAPTVSVLTSVGLEHTEVLGATEEAISFDKAHVGRRSRTLVYGPLSESALRGMERARAKIGFIPRAADPELLGSWPLALLRSASPWLELNRDNLVTALTALEAIIREPGFPATEKQRAIAGLKRCFWPARFDVRRSGGKTVILDGAHNSHALRHFVLQWRRSAFGTQRPLVLFGALADKDLDACIAALAPITASFVFTRPRSERAAGVETLSEIARIQAPEIPIHADADPATALASALDRSALVLCIGSLALMGDILEAMDEPVFPPGAA